MYFCFDLFVFVRSLSLYKNTSVYTRVAYLFFHNPLVDCSDALLITTKQSKKILDATSIFYITQAILVDSRL